LRVVLVGTDACVLEDRTTLCALIIGNVNQSFGVTNWNVAVGS
jgi:hypothetical protein